MPDLTNKTDTSLVADTGRSVKEWAAAQANHSSTAPGHGDWGRVDDTDNPTPPAP
jgi:hypothetical protein